MKQKNNRLIIAYDTNDIDVISRLSDAVVDIVPWAKIGFMAFSTAGIKTVSKFNERGHNTFVDMKFHDIPTTVNHNVELLTKYGADMINIHASNGFDTLKIAKETADITAAENNIVSPLILGVTVLTSMTETDIKKQTLSNITEHVIYLSEVSQQAGLDGVVASPLEIEQIRHICGDDFIIVTPGIRTDGSNSNDQHRFTTPEQAIKSGADYIVVGRSITESDNPRATTLEILDDIEKHT